MHFTLKQIAYFVAAAETSSITLAAARCRISQPSVSTAISALEEVFGIQLFIRHHAQGLSLTAAGQRFMLESRALLAQAEALEGAAGEISSRVSGQIEIGCLSTLYPLMIPDLLHYFTDRYPAARVNAVAGNQEELFAGLRSGALSLVLTYNMAVPRDIEFMPLGELPPFAYVSAKHPLAKRKTVSLAKLAEDPFILLDLPLSRDYFMMLFAHVGVTPDLVGRFPYIDVVRSVVARGDGFSLANARPKNQASLDGLPLAYLSLEEPLPALVHGIATMATARSTPTISAFVHLCRARLLNRKLPGTI
ncbi:LysR family transcriptional regulator [Acidisoma cladoniae]|jgi:DNA-binding transcriptional LysR family regulator|uniref:LysR family transcriptional regulator n=1 Tax=Acidisoma cladoniae TaxID=3040935 RepID=UPI00254A007C|nr:LysR family transcriptional regulator [Acidisoma sp. PAMC 29798]